MKNNTYNWRANRETRLVGMRYNPETIEDVEFAKEQIEEQYEAMQGFMKDLINISQIDWDEIRENVQKELDIQA